MKLYKFNMQKYGHNIELAYNHMRNIVDSDNATEKDWEEYNRVANLYSYLLGHSDGLYAYLTWDWWKEANETSIWAECYRASKN